LALLLLLLLLLASQPSSCHVVLFWSIRPDGTFDPKSFHGSCPVIKGEKWSATKW
jgi:prolyl 4-hydroxylase